MRKAMLTLMLAAVATAGVALGGEEKKCPYTMQECLQKMAQYMSTTGMIGLDGEWEEKTKGYRITEFIEGTTAQEAGVQIGDLLIKINGIALTDDEGRKRDADNRKPGSEAKITILRDGEKLTMKVTLIGIPAKVMAQEIGQHMLESHANLAAAKSE
jgi:C-terminal processing protease CtpA/Prc